MLINDGSGCSYSRLQHSMKPFVSISNESESLGQLPRLPYEITRLIKKKAGSSRELKARASAWISISWTTNIAGLFRDLYYWQNPHFQEKKSQSNVNGCRYLGSCSLEILSLLENIPSARATRRSGQGTIKVLWQPPPLKYGPPVTYPHTFGQVSSQHK